MPADHIVTVYGTTVLLCAPEGTPITGETSAVDVVGEALGERVELVAIPVERLTKKFFDLSTGVAGEIAQKFAHYDVRLAFVGDIAEQIRADDALAAWVHESNSSQELWFLPTFEDLTERLDRRRKPR